VLSLLLLFASAFAGDPEAVGATPETRAAEYLRLSEEMDRSATRANWVAVERLFAKLDEMGQPHTYAVLINAAQAARAVGDLATAKARLLQAHALKEDRSVAEWLWQIQEQYGPVLLAADLPANYRLVPKAMPFNPEHRRAVEFAQSRVLADSYFDGLLPLGQYVFAPYEPAADAVVFAFEARQNRQRFDVRTKDEPTRRDRKRRERIDRRLERAQAVGEATE
jgi:hypothetical protein